VDEIREIQRRLIEQGYRVGRVDGILGPQTRYAIGRFQVANGLPVTNDLDRRTIDRLFEG